jgi:hypothetical protein
MKSSPAATSWRRCSTVAAGLVWSARGRTVAGSLVVGCQLNLARALIEDGIPARPREWEALPPYTMLHAACTALARGPGSNRRSNSINVPNSGRV